MFREPECTPRRVILETGLKIFTRLDDDFVRQQCHTAIDNWRRLCDAAEEIAVLMWIGDGDEVFNFSGNLDDTFRWNDTIGFNNLKYNAYPENPHYRNGHARPYMDDPPKVTYRDLKRIIATYREVARDMLGKPVMIGTTIDAGPEFVESPFKFERHRELLKGGPESDMPRSLQFLCCYAEMDGDNAAYAGFPDGLPQGTHFGTFLGRQLRLMSEAVGFDYVWLSNGFGLTHYAWNYLGECFNGHQYRPDLAPESIRKFVSFWTHFREEYPTGRIDFRGTNFSIGMDATAHGIDVREIYRQGQPVTPAPNPPWGSSNLGLEIAAHLSRISATPTRAILYRYYINDSWFAVVPWYDYYAREPFDVYCPLSCGRMTETGAVETPTDLSIMTVNTGYGEMPTTQADEVTPHLKRGFNLAPDAAGPLVWVYPFSEYQDELHRSDGQIQKSFFGDWIIAKAIDAGLPLCTVITTDNFAKLVTDDPAKLAGRVLVAPAPAADWQYARKLVDYVKGGGKVMLYGSLHDAPKDLLKLLNVKLDEPVEGDLEATLKMTTDAFEKAPTQRRVRHIARINDGGICEQVANTSYKCTTVKATVGRGKGRRVYALSRKSRQWKGGQVAWIRGSLPFDATPDSLEPVLFDTARFADTTVWLRYLLAEFGLTVRQSRHDVTTRPANLFISRNRGMLVLSGHKRDATVSVELGLPDGAPIPVEREVRVKNSRGTFFFDRSFQHEVVAVVDQKAESLVSYKEKPTSPTQMRAFQLSGMKKATVSLYVPSEALDKGGLHVRQVVQYVIQDPTAAERLKKKLKVKDLSELERDLPWTVDPVTGAAVVKQVTGSIEVRY